MEKEIKRTVDLCLPSGRLNPTAVGWSRTPLHRISLGGWGRNKRFEYWCVTSPGAVVAVAASDTDYRSGCASFFLDRETLRSVSLADVRWLSGVPSLAATWGTTTIRNSGKNLRVEMVPTDEGMSLRADSARLQVDLDVRIPESHESMSVVVPWSRRVFQYTRKHNCLPARGRVVADGVEYTLDAGESYATLDHGRGRWPYSTLWNWASASGNSNGHEIGLQFGGKWTVGTPSTENSIRVDGRVEKISEELEWTYDSNDFMAPWRIRGNRVDLTFHPEYERASKFDRWVVLSRENQVFGHFTGTVTAESGQSYGVDNLYGWAEEVHRRW